MDDEINVNVWYIGVFAYQYYPDMDYAGSVMYEQSDFV